MDEEGLIVFKYEGSPDWRIDNCIEARDNRGRHRLVRELHKKGSHHRVSHYIPNEIVVRANPDIWSEEVIQIAERLNLIDKGPAIWSPEQNSSASFKYPLFSPRDSETVYRVTEDGLVIYREKDVGGIGDDYWEEAEISISKGNSVYPASIK